MEDEDNRETVVTINLDDDEDAFNEVLHGRVEAPSDQDAPKLLA